MENTEIKEVDNMEFVQVFQNGQNNIISDRIIKGEVFMDSLNTLGDNLTISNCEFKNKLWFRKISIGRGIIFENCKFNEGIYFVDINGDDQGIQYRFNKYNIIFNKCLVDKVLVVDNSTIKLGLIIDNKSKINECLFQNVNIGANGKLEIKDSNCNEGITIYHSQIGGRFKIEQSEIAGSIRVFGLNTTNISFQQSKFQDFFLILGAISQSLSIGKCEFYGKIELDAVEIKDNLTLHGVKVSKEFIITLYNEANLKKGIINELYLFETELDDGLILNGNNLLLNKLYIQFTNRLKGIIQVSDCKIKEVILKGVNMFCNLIFNTCTIRKLEFNSFSNYNNLSFNNCNKSVIRDSILLIANSGLGKTQFNNFNFLNFKSLQIIDSTIGDILCYNVIWFEDTNFNTSVSGIEDFRKRREIYRQIKYALEKSGDKIGAIKFKALEMNYFERILKFNNGHLPDRITLLLYKTNDFGLNWVKPLVLLFLTTFLFCILITISADNKLVFGENSEFDFYHLTDELVKYSTVLPQLFNPTRFVSRMFESLSDYNLNAFVYWLDSIQRVFFAFFVFQIIVAFRKFHEK